MTGPGFAGVGDVDVMAQKRCENRSAVFLRLGGPAEANPGHRSSPATKRSEIQHIIVGSTRYAHDLLDKIRWHIEFLKSRLKVTGNGIEMGFVEAAFYQRRMRGPHISPGVVIGTSQDYGS